MAFEESTRRDDVHTEAAKKRARWEYIQPFMEEIRKPQPSDDEPTDMPGVTHGIMRIATAEANLMQRCILKEADERTRPA